MAAQSPPYVLQAGSHSAELFRRTQQMLLSADGVVGAGDLAVTAGGGMTVNVAPGQTVINGTLGSTSGMVAGFTSQGAYSAYNDAVVNLAIAASNPTNARIDLVVASVQDSYYSGAANQWVLQVVTGTPAVTPAPPAVPASSNVLAQVAVPAGAASIVAGNITDQRAFMATVDGPRLAALPARVLTGQSTVTTNSGGAATITLPATFTTAPNVVVCGSSSGGAHQIFIYSSTTTTFTVAVYTLTGTLVVSGGPLLIAWIAAGT